jgi:hypothetical protein
MAEHFAFHREEFICLLICEHSTPLSYSSYIHYILVVNRAEFTMDFCSTDVLSVKKAVNNANFAAGGIIIHSTHRNLFCKDKNKY